MLDGFCPIPKCLTTHLSYHRFLVDGVPCALIAKTKSNQSQEREATLFRGPPFLPHVYVPMGESVLEA